MLVYERVDLDQHPRPLLVHVWDYASGTLHPVRLDIRGAFTERGGQ